MPVSGPLEVVKIGSRRVAEQIAEPQRDSFALQALFADQRLQEYLRQGFRRLRRKRGISAPLPPSLRPLREPGPSTTPAWHKLHDLQRFYLRLRNSIGLIDI
jgi:hypothetical protein